MAEKRKDASSSWGGRGKKITIAARPWGARAAPRAGPRRWGARPCPPPAAHRPRPRAGLARRWARGAGDLLGRRAPASPPPPPPARARPPHENRKRAVPARAARGPPKRPAGGRGGGGRRIETKPESHRTARTGPPGRLPRHGVGAWPRGEESLIQGGATTHQRKPRAERETRGAGCSGWLEPRTHAPVVDKETARGEGSGNDSAGLGDPPWKHPLAPQRPRRESTQRAPAAITLAAHAAGRYL